MSTLKELPIYAELHCIGENWVTLIGFTQIPELYSLLRVGNLILPTLCHSTSIVLEVLLEPGLCFILVERLSNSFGYVFRIIHAPFTIGIVPPL